MTTDNLTQLAAKVPEVAEWRKRLPPPDPALSPWLGSDQNAVGRWCDYQGAHAALDAVADYVARLEQSIVALNDALNTWQSESARSWEEKQQAVADNARLRAEVEKLKQFIRVLEGLE